MVVPLPAGDPDVLDVLVRRRDAGSRPGLRTDGLRTALVVEGGGMRGAYTGGMVRGLTELRLRDSFDEIFGTSSGAYVAAAFATGQGVGAATIYADDLSGTRFIDYRRPLTCRGPVMHFDYLIDTVLVTSKPLDFAALTASDVPVRPIATLAATLPPARPRRPGHLGPVAHGTARDGPHPGAGRAARAITRPDVDRRLAQRTGRPAARGGRRRDPRAGPAVPHPRRARPASRGARPDAERAAFATR